MIRAQDQEIQSLVTDIRDGKLLLPEMQRGYVWKADQVRDLFDSLYYEYPSGQLLVWETDELPSSGTRQASVEGLSEIQRRPQLLLDGQQRLTSLTAVMFGRQLRVRDTPKPIDIVFNVYTEKFEVAGPRQRGQDGWVSLVKLFTEGAVSVLFEDLQLNPKNPDAKLVLERLTRIENIKKYKYRVNVLEHLNYAEVTRIFVRTNSGGTKLGNADLALAQVSSSWQGVTDEFEQYQRQVEIRGVGLKLDNGLLLRAIVVLLTGQSRFTLLREDKQLVTVDDLKAAWERAKKAIDQATAFLVQNCLIDRLDMLPTRNLLIPLVAFFDRYGASMSNIQSRDLQRWVYMALIWTRYSTSSESTIDQDIAALKKENSVQAMIQNIENAVGRRPITELELRDQRKNSPYMVMAYVLARRAKAQDWFDGVVIGNDHTQEYHLHHIFSQQLLRSYYKTREDNLVVGQVANLVFLSAPVPKDILKSAPVEYLPKIEKQRLQAQYVPNNAELWTLEKFEKFLFQRRTLLADAINHLLISLTKDKQVWTSTPVAILESRVNFLERQLHTLVETRLNEARGEGAWEHLVPSDIRLAAERRIKQHVLNKPYESDQHKTLSAKLDFCLFSDYFAIIKANWSLFDDVFGRNSVFEQHMRPVVDARNAMKHGRSLDRIELADAEGGLLWLEECMRNIEIEAGSEDDMLIKTM